MKQSNKRLKGFQQGNKAGVDTRFSTLRQPKNNGRKPLMSAKALRKYGCAITKEDFRKSVAILINLSYAELEALIERGKRPNDQAPIWLTVVAEALLQSARKGSAKLIMHFLDVVIGRPTKKNDVNPVNSILNVGFERMTPEELELLNYLLSKL